MVRYDWSLPVQSGGCRFDPYDFEACVVFSKRFEFKNFTCKMNPVKMYRHIYVIRVLKVLSSKD